MVRIIFDAVARAAITFQPGDELVVSKMTPELESLINSGRIDGSKVARLSRTSASREQAVLSTDGQEARTTRRGTTTAA